MSQNSNRDTKPAAAGKLSSKTSAALIVQRLRVEAALMQCGLKWNRDGNLLRIPFEEFTVGCAVECEEQDGWCVCLVASLGKAMLTETFMDGMAEARAACADFQVFQAEDNSVYVVTKVGFGESVNKAVLPGLLQDFVVACLRAQRVLGEACYLQPVTEETRS
jgi:hypothetical protein